MLVKIRYFALQDLEHDISINNEAEMEVGSTYGVRQSCF